MPVHSSASLFTLWYIMFCSSHSPNSIMWLTPIYPPGCHLRISSLGSILWPLISCLISLPATPREGWLMNHLPLGFQSILGLPGHWIIEILPIYDSLHHINCDIKDWGYVHFCLLLLGLTQCLVYVCRQSVNKHSLNSIAPSRVPLTGSKVFP